MFPDTNELVASQRIIAGPPAVQVTVTYRDEFVGRFTLRQVNKVMAYSCDLFIRQDLQGKGLYRPLHQLKCKIARERGFRTLIATVKADNEHELKAAERNGWTIYTSIDGLVGRLYFMMYRL